MFSTWAFRRNRYHISFILHEACTFLIVITTCKSERKVYHLDSDITKYTLHYAWDAQQRTLNIIVDITKSLFHPGSIASLEDVILVMYIFTLTLVNTCQEYIKCGLRLYSSMFTDIFIINYLSARKGQSIWTEGPHILCKHYMKQYCAFYRKFTTCKRTHSPKYLYIYANILWQKLITHILSYNHNI